jgi:two-component sensor histidine kinase
VKNSLATVQAMAMQTLKGVDAPARDAFLARLFALSSQHGLLTMDNWEGASLEGVVRRALRPWREEGQTRFTVDGPAVHLDTKWALALGMGFHELATNAARYGALSNTTGIVAVSWDIAPDGRTLRLIWRETGGPAVAYPQRKGFGLRLVEHGLGRELGGMVKLDFAADGLVCEWIMKLE